MSSRCDLARALEQHPTLDRDRLISCFGAYMTHARTPVSRAEFEANLAENDADAAFLRDVHALLAILPGGAFDAGFAYDSSLSFDHGIRDAYDAKAALALLRRELIERLPGAAWKGTR